MLVCIYRQRQRLRRRSQQGTYKHKPLRPTMTGMRWQQGKDETLIFTFVSPCLQYSSLPKNDRLEVANRTGMWLHIWGSRLLIFTTIVYFDQSSLAYASHLYHLVEHLPRHRHANNT